MFEENEFVTRAQFDKAMDWMDLAAAGWTVHRGGHSCFICPKCFAMVAQEFCLKHTAWHAKEDEENGK